MWIIAAAASTDARLGLWGAGAAIDLTRHLARPPLLHRRLVSERVEFADEHLMERCRLFLLIALGETVATPGTASATAPDRRADSRWGLSSRSQARLCLWWLYFHAEPLALRHVARTDDRMYASRMATNGLLFMIAGLIALAAGNALVINHPSREATLAVALMVCGGPGIFLLARAWYQRRMFAAAPRPQVVTTGLLGATAAAVRTAPALVASLATVAVSPASCSSNSSGARSVGCAGTSCVK